MLSLYNVTHLHTWIEFGIHMSLLLEMKLEPTTVALLLPYVKPTVISLLKRKGAYHINVQSSHIVLPNNF